MRKVITFLFMIGACTLNACAMGVDIGNPGSGTNPAVATTYHCGGIEYLYGELGNPAYCYPDQCCVWEYYDYDGWLCEETWCEYWGEFDCWWENISADCWY